MVYDEPVNRYSALVEITFYTSPDKTERNLHVYKYSTVRTIKIQLGLFIYADLKDTRNRNSMICWPGPGVFQVFLKK